LIGTEARKPLSRAIYFYYAVKTASEAAYDQEIIDYQANIPGMAYNLHCTDKMGYLTGTKIKSDIPDFNKCLFFICGPQALMESLSAQLQQLGVKMKNIIYEDFSFGVNG
jgi:ferredoxin-NADP reductase